ASTHHTAEPNQPTDQPSSTPRIPIRTNEPRQWLQQQAQPAVWARLLPEQQERLSQLGVTPAEAPSPAPATKGATKGQSKASQAFQRGLTALTQWLEREGHRPVPRKAVEVLPDGTETNLGVWVANTRARRDKLTPEQLDALRELGVEWV
ncbi:helicase associated domain-containing protein, partial [Streptomyces sp. NPDC001276]|uniref:helicase associated domain-containing protein n=1 Tax=Streptomyces sp. NPDC001276 TaxID=3364555 RepID=UPI0036A1623D